MAINFKTVLVIALLSFTKNFAQVGIPGNNPDKSAVLDLNASNKGLLIPRIALASTTDKTKIAGGNPAQSLLVYNTNASITGTNAAGTGYYYWDTNIWKKMIVANDNSSDWKLDGNLNGGIKLIGTIDNYDFPFITNYIERMRLDATGNLNIATQTPATVASASSSSLITHQKAVLTVGDRDAYINGLTIGKGGGQFSTNTVLGYQTLYNNNVGGEYNVAIGEQTMFSNTSGKSNMAVGRQSLFTNTTGSFNSGSGYRSLYANTTGNNNVANGDTALYQNTIGNSNTAVGFESLYSNTTGNNNIALGYRAGSAQNSGDYNIVIGTIPNTNGLNTSGSNQLNIGNTIFGTGINTNTTGAGNIGIGTVAPATKLEVNNGTTAGAIKIVDGTQGLNKVLTSDADGLATWVTPAAQSADWKLGGNNNGTIKTIGTNDNYDLPFVTNNTEKMRLDVNGNVNIGITTPATVASSASTSAPAKQVAQLTVASGDASINSLTVGFGGGQNPSNTVIGYQALYNNIGATGITAIGNQALFSNTNGINNTAIGHYALKTNTTGQFNTAIGSWTLQKNLSGDSNVAIGSQTLSTNTTGYRNTATGAYALYYNTIGATNAAFGYQALYTNSTGSSNAALGHKALWNNNTGANNVAVGDNALFGNTSGNNNIALGTAAGSNQTSGSNNIIIGTSMDLPNPTGSNQMNIGNIIFGTGINTGSIGAGSIGIGTTTPSNKLEINGTGGTATGLKLPTGASSGKVLTSDPNGNAVWQSSAIQLQTAVVGDGGYVLVSVPGGGIPVQFKSFAPVADFDDAAVIYGSGYGWNGTTQSYTVPRAGKYRISLQIYFNQPGAGRSGENWRVWVDRNDQNTAAGPRMHTMPFISFTTQGSGSDCSVYSSGVVSLLQGDKLDVKLTNGSTGPVGIYGGASHTILLIESL